MIISIDIENAFGKIWHTLKIKSVSTLGIGGIFLKLIRNIDKILTASIILNGEELDTFPTRSQTRQKCSISLCLLNILIGI